MKQVVNNRWLVSLLVVVVVLISTAEQVTSQPTDRNSTLMRYYCSMYRGISREYFLANLNTTMSSLRRQLTSSNYAVARTLFNGESVWGLAWCRGYLSSPDCLDCFDYAVNQLKVCGLGNSAHAIYSDCNVRYDDYEFYLEANYKLYLELDYSKIYHDTNSAVLCDNSTSPQPTAFRKAAESLLLDLQIAAPRTTNFYAASTRKVGSNARVYAVAECKLNVSHIACLKCLKLISRSLYDCLPTTSGRAMYVSCFMRYDMTPFFGQNQQTDITTLLRDDSRKKRDIIGVIVGGVCSLILACTFFVWSCIWKRTSRGQQGELSVTLDAPAELKGIVNYSYTQLQVATNNFCIENIIGKGGFGEVFKASLDNKKVVAVKRLKGGYDRAKIGFENEILLISHIRHRNLLQLQGWCSEGDNLLVFEYMSNGSLDRFLWGERRGVLNWKRRCNIILGIAKGLAHLHKEFHVRIVHRDIKSSNILLDDDFQPKIADFGLARFQHEDQSHVITKFAGTLGYTAPEYVLYGILSDKVDTFSFGIVVLEIISGRKCTYRNFDGASTDCLLEHAWTLYENRKSVKLLDETLDVNPVEVNHVIKIIEIALLCTQSQVSERPTMSEVVLMLRNDPSLGQRQLTRPTFTDHNRRILIGS